MLLLKKAIMENNQNIFSFISNKFEINNSLSPKKIKPKRHFKSLGRKYKEIFPLPHSFNYKDFICFDITKYSIYMNDDSIKKYLFLKSVEKSVVLKHLSYVSNPNKNNKIKIIICDKFSNTFKKCIY